MTTGPSNQFMARLHCVIESLRGGEPSSALAQAQTLCAQYPQAPDSWILLAAAQKALDESDGARTALLRAIAIAPDHPAANNNLGSLHLEHGNVSAARDCFAITLAHEPWHVEARLNLAATYLQLDDHANALSTIETALGQVPELADAHFLHGLCLQAAGRHAQAIAAYAQAESLEPTDARFPYQRGAALEECKRFEEAHAAFSTALGLDPNAIPVLAQAVFLRRRLCEWQGLEPLSARLLAAVRAGQPGATAFSFLSEPANASDQLLCARIQASQVLEEAGLEPACPVSFVPPVRADAPIRIGFLSNGFGTHPTALLTVALFEELRHQAGIETHLFALNPDDGSPIRQRLLRAVKQLHDVTNQTSHLVAQSIASANIEVLFDLRGWGGGGKPGVLALRPSPIQVNWLAYPGTSGAPWIDYILADRFVLPERSTACFSETVAWLPRCFQPSDTRRLVAAPPSRIDCGLPESGVVFCCFNNSYKINPASFGRAMAILHGVPDSVLWLLAGPGLADQRLSAAARDASIDPKRLIFMEKQPHGAYLARLQQADLFLDTNPYNAHTTASDALWANCPVLTKPGETFASRVAGSLNHHLGMPEMNATSDDHFVQCAIELGRNRQLLRSRRDEIQKRKLQSSLFDMPGFAIDFTAMVASMVQRHRCGLPPVRLPEVALDSLP